MKTKLTLLLVVAAISIGQPNSATAQVNVQDSLALVDLYNSTDGPHWYRHDNWLTSVPVKNWFGILVSRNRVTRIFMGYYSNNLKGSIPSSLVNLTNLSGLSLKNNQLSGSIPSELGKLTNLRSLSLGNNQLSGSIPSELGKLTNLRSLGLGNNQLSGSIPSELGNLTNLRILGLSNNQLSGSIPSELGNLTNLSSLHLNNNQLSGGILQELGNLTNLSILLLDHNQLSGNIPPELGNLTNLSSLHLNNNQLSGNIPASLANVSGVYSKVDLSNNQLSGSIPSEFGNSNVRYLILSNNQLSGSIPPEFGNSNVRHLILSNNQLSGSIPPEFGNSNVWYLILSNNQLSGSIPPELGNLLNLRELILNNNQLSGSIPPELGNLIKLQDLNLSNNRLSGSIPASLGNLLRSLRLHLENNKFTFDGMELLEQSYYDISYNPQANISIHQNTNSLSVSAGGTLSNNTYQWYLVDESGSETITGDSVFYPSQDGKYYAAVNNSVCTQLTLYTDTIFYSGALPVTMGNLKAYQQKNIIKVEWTGFTEINMQGYEIQRSPGNADFIAVGKQVATGNGTEKTNYSFNDLQPLNGKNYYRIKAFDKDGKTTYSNTVLVNIDNDKPITIVYPNPANTTVTVLFNANGNYSMKLTDASGNILQTKTNVAVGNNNRNTVRLDVSKYAAGIYFITIINEKNESHSIKLNKEN